MHHTSAFYASIANTAADQQINALADTILQTRDNALIVPIKAPKLMLAAGFGTNLSVVKLKPPSLSNFGDYLVEPYANAIGGAGALTPYLDLTDQFGAGPALDLDETEELPAYGQQGSGGAQDAYVIVGFTDKALAPHKGKFITVRATASTTLVAKTWSNVNLTMDKGLPKGRYALVGARVKSAGILAFRFVHQEGWNRPGGLGNQGDTSFEPIGQRNGGWGVWFLFDHLTLPSLDILATSADTSETVYMDLERVG